MDASAWRSSWSDAWRALGASTDDAVLAELLARYGEAHRAYHTLQHLGECLAQLARERGAAERPAEVALALWFHDAIYDVQRHDNEARSADARLLVDIDLAILGATPARFAEYERQIRIEYAHVPPEIFEPRRRQILSGFLARDPLYLTAPIRTRLEAAARSNLGRAIAR